MKKILLFFILIFLGWPYFVLASNNQLFEDRIIELSIKVSQIRRTLYDILYSLPPFQDELGNYLKIFFEAKGIHLTKYDFLRNPENPYLEFAKILNLIPQDYLATKKVNKYLAEDIKKKFLKIEDKIYLDGLLGKIDIHEHYRQGGNLDSFFNAAGLFGISKAVFVPTGFGPDNKNYQTYQKYLLRYVKKLYPERVIAFCTIDEADPEAAEVFEECLKEGGQGLKLMGGHPNFYDVPLDSQNMYKVYKIAEKYKVPVLIHGSIINIPEVKDQLERVYTDFPKVTFIHAHYCSAIFKGINLDKCADLLDKYPNLYIYLSMGGGIGRYHKYLKQDLEQIKDFVVKYQNRILFGSDIILDSAKYKTSPWIYSRIKCDIDLHQKERYTCAFGQKDWIHQGFNLDKTILQKLYWENPMKILGSKVLP